MIKCKNSVATSNYVRTGVATLLVVAVTTAAVAGCGQKGPLKLPSAASPNASSASSASAR